MGAVGKGLLEELETLGDLFGGVDVEGSLVFFGEGGEVDTVAMEGTVAIGEGAGVLLGCGVFFGQEWSLCKLRYSLDVVIALLKLEI